MLKACLRAGEDSAALQKQCEAALAQIQELLAENQLDDFAVEILDPESGLDPLYLSSPAVGSRR